MNKTTLVYHDTKDPEMELIVTAEGLYAPIGLGTCEAGPQIQEDALDGTLVGNFPQDAGDLKGVIVDGVYHKIQQKPEGLAVYECLESGDVLVTQDNGVLTGFFFDTVVDDPRWVYCTCKVNKWSDEDCAVPQPSAIGPLVGYVTQEAYREV